MRDVDPEETLQCVWDFVRLRQSTIDQLPDFVRRWGLLEWNGDSMSSTTKGDQPLDDWGDAAKEIDCLLRAFAMTEQDELIPEGMLWELRGGDRRTYYSWKAEMAARPIPASEVIHVELARQRKYFDTERRAGRGVALQRELIVNLLGEIAMPPEDRTSDGYTAVPLLFGFSWDERGRRVEARATGVREIVASHLLSIFGASQPDVFLCSICGTPFSTQSARTQRRPRAGVKRLCSEACRLEAKRESNRTSWNKNKDRWRPSSSAKGGKRVR